MTALKITAADIEANIASEHYFTAYEGVYGNEVCSPTGSILRRGTAIDLLTFCVIVLRNGFTVVGQSACVSPENFNAETGRKVARENAINEIWPLMGYELKSKLHKDAVK